MWLEPQDRELVKSAVAAMLEVSPDDSARRRYRQLFDRLSEPSSGALQTLASGASSREYEELLAGELSYDYDDSSS